MPAPLTITTPPFKSSNLATPPSPFSPRLPITPPASPPRTYAPWTISNKRPLSSPTTPPPSPPLKWVWQCHICRRVYPLGATRRCLDDGHYFCSGTTTVKTWRTSRKAKKIKKHRACASEFDYSGWDAFGRWRRREAELRAAATAASSVWADDEASDSGYGPSPGLVLAPRAMKKRDCWNQCDFPSECRWGKQFGVEARGSASADPLLPSPEEENPPSYATLDEPDASRSEGPRMDLQMPKLSTSTSPSSYAPPTTFDDILDGNRLMEGKSSPSSPKEVRDRFWDGLLDSARQRRKSKGGSSSLLPPSPLALNPVVEQPEEEEEEEEEQEEEEGEHETSGVLGVAVPASAFASQSISASIPDNANCPSFPLSSMSHKLFSALDKFTLPGLGDAKDDEIEIPEPAAVVPSSSSSSSYAVAQYGFDFGFEEQKPVWDDDVPRAAAGCFFSNGEQNDSAKDSKWKGRLRKRKSFVRR